MTRDHPSIVDLESEIEHWRTTVTRHGEAIARLAQLIDDYKADTAAELNLVREHAGCHEAHQQALDDALRVRQVLREYVADETDRFVRLLDGMQPERRLEYLAISRRRRAAQLFSEQDCVELLLPNPEKFPVDQSE